MTLASAGVNEPASLTGRTSRNASDPSPEKKYCGSASMSCCGSGGRGSAELSRLGGVALPAGWRAGCPTGLRYAAGSLTVAAADRTTDSSCVRNCSSAGSSGALGSILPARSRACLSSWTSVSPFHASGPIGPLKQRPHPGQVVLDRLDLLRRQEQQRPRPQVPQVHLVEQAVEDGPACRGRRRPGIPAPPHPGAVVALDDDDHVVVVAEFGEVCPPALLIVLVRVDQVAALGAVFEPGVEAPTPRPAIRPSRRSAPSTGRGKRRRPGRRANGG